MATYLEPLSECGFPLRVRNGVSYWELVTCPNTRHVASAILDDVYKLTYPASTFTVDLVADSWKYGAELQFKSYSRQPPVKVRRTDKEHDYYRLECGYLPLTLATAEALEDAAAMVRLYVRLSEGR